MNQPLQPHCQQTTFQGLNPKLEIKTINWAKMSQRPEGLFRNFASNIKRI